MPKIMYPKDFIQQVFIDEMSVLKDTNPYISFAIMAIGIEFLGKSLNPDATHWNISNSKKDFNNALNTLESFKKYRPLIEKYDLWDSLRNGFAHSFVPKGKLSLSSKNEDPHLKINGDRINLRCEDLYSDFKNACIEIINMNFPEDNKMQKPLLEVPA